jgi:hypothetical protein
MDKKKFTSWIVSLASIAYIVGIILYLGISNNVSTVKTQTVAQTQVTTQSSTEAHYKQIFI